MPKQKQSGKKFRKQSRTRYSKQSRPRYSKQSGGGFFDKKPEHIAIFKRAQKSEKELIKHYKAHVKASIKQADGFKKHIGNLKALDEIMPDGFDSFAEVFITRVMNDIKISKNPDTSSPLMLANYKVENDSDKDDLAARHLWQQCEFVRRTKFAPQDAVLISKIAVVELGQNTFTMVITGINFAKDHRYSIPHKNFTADLPALRVKLADVIASIRRDVMTDAIKNSVYSKQDDRILPIPPALGASVQPPPDRKGPTPDIYGVKRFIDAKPNEIPAIPFGDNKADFGKQKPAYLIAGPQKPALEPPNPPVDSPNQEQKPVKPASGAPNQFGNFGQERPFKSPDAPPYVKQHDRNDRPPGKHNKEFKQQGQRNNRAGDRFKKPIFQRASKRIGARSRSKRQSRRGSPARGPPQPFGLDI